MVKITFSHRSKWDLIKSILECAKIRKICANSKGICLSLFQHYPLYEGPTFTNPIRSNSKLKLST